ncbi:MAG: hypothetical protein GWN99_01575 [Gemmatimonadetes bacterium]|uniref:Uncharacterized protein n=1 Tax=Candidatus Kutchimonas denitrificans TaxID=3056748 RepID=A0AAE5C9Y8_9BACT|nr:hypothetical protein [Gemmatimonadota bacterium]NIR73952.1 hypothetical protein [Candidatus Kutchimonas denitrificans]NIR99758.1 hypothetical protein [Gemmatimonadota bacterium]NIT65343.1 hypothetical protein [Gemmatimonadota bacterium]NIW73792.1 hypothetical protein [Gemmatimonadota bacterium]
MQTSRLYSDRWPVGNYLVRVGDREFEIPADFGRIRFAGLQDASFASLTRDFGESAVTYRRTGVNWPLFDSRKA